MKLDPHLLLRPSHSGGSAKAVFTQVVGNGPLLTGIVTVLLAIVGYFVSAHQTRIAEQYKSRLTRIDTQLREFYGPLYFLVEAEHRSFVEFVIVTRPGHQTFWETNSPPSQGEQISWRRWITTVSIPDYNAMEDVLRKHSDLIIEDRMPEPLLNLAAHIAGYKPVVEAWSKGDYSQNVSFFNFPDSVREYLRERYEELKTEQRILLGKLGTTETE